MFGKGKKHKHGPWEVVSKTFQPPSHRVNRVRNVDEELLLRMAYGMTTITQRCTTCGWTTATNVSGRAD